MAVDNKVIVDRKDKVYEITSSSTFPSADVSQTVTGVIKVEIDTGSGYATFYENTDHANPNYTIPIDGVGTVGDISNDILIALAEDSDLVTIMGTYKFTFTDQYDISASPTTISQAVSFNYTSNVSVSPCLSSLLSCMKPEVKVSDSSTYVSGGITPIFETSVMLLNYPETSGQADLEVSSVPFQLITNNVWTKGYNVTSNIVALYDFTNYLERIESIAELSFDVECNSLCSVYDCIASFKNEMDTIRFTNQSLYAEMLADYLYIMALSSNVLSAEACSKESALLVNEISGIINASNCDTGCTATSCTSDVSTKVRGAYNDPLTLENAYIGVGGTNPTNSAEVLALDETVIYNSTFILNTGSTETKFKVCLPPQKTIASVVNRDAYDQNLIEDYISQGTVPVVINGVAHNYNVYVMDSAIPYSTNNRHEFIVS